MAGKPNADLPGTVSGVRGKPPGSAGATNSNSTLPAWPQTRVGRQIGTGSRKRQRLGRFRRELPWALRYNRRVTTHKSSSPASPRPAKRGLPGNSGQPSQTTRRRAKKAGPQVASTLAPPLRAPGVRVLKAPKLARIPWLLHGFSTRQGGVSEAYGGRQLNLGLTAEDSAENVERNRQRFVRKLRATDTRGIPWPLVALKQMHSAAIHRVVGPTRRAASPGVALPEGGDGLITNARGVLLAVKVADCLPVIVVDRRRKAVGVFHAGWRGTVQRIVEKGVGEMRRQLGCDPADLVAAIGPGIGACCYEIGEQVEDKFDSQFTYSKELFSDVFDSHNLKMKYPMLFLNQRAPGHGEPALSRHLDLMEANRRQLLDAGVEEENIESLGLCTACHTDLFFSYRQEHVTGRMLAVVGIR